MDKNLAEIKTVPFMGQNLMAAKAEDGTIFAGVSYICNGMGLSKSQKDAQIQNIQKDDVLSRGCLKFQAGVFDPNNTTLALKLDYLPLWLAKISITPTMKAENPKLAERLVQYQLKAKDALAALALAAGGLAGARGLGGFVFEFIYHRADGQTAETFVAG